MTRQPYEQGGVPVFFSAAGCVSSWHCAVDFDGTCHNCGDVLEPAPPSECCSAAVVVFSPQGPAQCADCGLSPTYPIGVHWPPGVESFQWPADWADDLFSDGECPDEEVEWLLREGWQPVGVSPRRDVDRAGELTAQYLLTR